MDTAKGITIDQIIAKFVPILGALLFITGLGYLIYTSVWELMGPTIRLGVGFFVSLAIIGSAFSFSDRLRYFADVVMGGGILLLYGTLIYGSRTSDIAVAAHIPEIATLGTAFVFTLIVAYFSSLRKSKVILALGILGAYLTPFIIGQNDVWSSNISFNAYLIYFTAVNVVIFLMGREIAIHDLIPLNLLGLFFGTYTLHALIYSETIAQVSPGFFQGSVFTLMLLTLLVMMSIMSIAYSSRYFSPKQEGGLSAGYLIPLFWFIFHVESLIGIASWMETLAFGLVSVAYFLAWNYLRPLESSRYQHIAAYAGGLISIVLALKAFFPEFDLYASLLIAYIGVIFMGLYAFGGGKSERFLAAFLFTLFGALLALHNIYREDSLVLYPTLFALIALVPAMTLAPLVYLQNKSSDSIKHFANTYSIMACVIAVCIIGVKVLKTLDFSFALFVLPGFLLVLMTYIQGSRLQHRGTYMQVGTVWLSLGFFSSFIFFISNLIPHIADNEHFWKGGGIFTNWHVIKGVFAIITYFLALSVSRQIQRAEKTDRPSFLLVIVGYTTLLLLVNFAIITFCNDLGIALTTGGPRAIVTTLWWVILAITMLMMGIHFGHGYRSEKLLGLLLLLLTIGKIAFYDLSSMDMNKKIIVLMGVGGLILVFSYFLQVKGYLKEGKSE